MVFPRAKVHKNSSAIELKKWKRMVLGKAKFCICILLAATVLRLQNHKCESPVSNTVFKIQSFYSDSELYLCRSFFRASTWHYHIHPVSHTTLTRGAPLLLMQIAFSISPSNMQAWKEPISTFLRLRTTKLKSLIYPRQKKPARDLISFLCKSKQEDVSVPFAESLFPFSSQSENLLQ